MCMRGFPPPFCFSFSLLRSEHVPSNGKGRGEIKGGARLSCQKEKKRKPHKEKSRQHFYEGT